MTAAFLRRAWEVALREEHDAGVDARVSLRRWATLIRESATMGEIRDAETELYADALRIERAGERAARLCRAMNRRWVVEQLRAAEGGA